MATVTLARFRELLARATGWYLKGTATGGGTNTVIDTSVLGSDGIDVWGTNKLVNMWIHILSGSTGDAPDFEARRITSVSSTTATVSIAFSAAVASSDTYEILPQHPRLMDDVIQEAIRTSYPLLYLPLRDESLKVDNLLANWDFETFTTPDAADSWTQTGAGGTWTEETTRYFQGTSSAKVISGGGAIATLHQDLFTSINPQDVSGKSITASVRAWNDGGTANFLRLSFDGGSTFTSSTAHSGLSEWENLTVTTTVPTTATSISVYLEAQTAGGAGGTVYWDDAYCAIDQVTRYTLPTTFIGSPAVVSQQALPDVPDGRYDPITETFPAVSGRIIRLEGQGRFTVPTADSTTITLDETQAELIVAKAASAMYRRLMSQDPVQEDRHRERSDYWASQVEMYARQPGVRMRAMPGVRSFGAVRFTEDATARYIELVR